MERNEDEVKLVGFWHSQEDPHYPMPVAHEADWAGGAAFRAVLTAIQLRMRNSQKTTEPTGKVTFWKGLSHCRLCNERAGSGDYELGGFKWPSGYMHYLSEHFVRPDPEFARFIAEWSKDCITFHGKPLIIDINELMETNMPEQSKQENFVYLSWRNLPLLYVGKPLDKPVLTLENYTKWYRVQLVMPDGLVIDVPSGKILEANDKISIHGWVDHLFHPKLLIQLAKDLEAYTDERALEAAGGRWLREHDGFHELIKLYPELDFTGEND